MNALQAVVGYFLVMGVLGVLTLARGIFLLTNRKESYDS